MTAPADHASDDERPKLETLYPAAYEDLRRLARYYMARERQGASLQATALVNEAYLRLLGAKSPPWCDRAHFRAIAARAMREILVEQARARAARKRGGSRVRVSLGDAPAPGGPAEADLLAVHEALERLEAHDAELARLVEFRFFGGLTIEETAGAMGRSPASVKRDWQLARAWLRRELEA